jgi:3-oxoacyl-[acyl-carrier protein] reductase
MPDGSMLIFGGGRGIGLAVAETFVNNGFGVTVAARTPGEIGAAVQILSAVGFAQGCLADVAEPGQVQDVVGAHIEKFGEIGAVINAAAIQGPIGYVWETDPHEWRKSVLVNLAGSFNVCRAVLPLMMKQNFGALIFFSGGGAAYARPHFSAYGSSKTGVLRLVETINEELHEAQTALPASEAKEAVKVPGVFVYAVAPGAVYTRMTEEVLSSEQSAGKKAFTEALKTQREGGVPLSRVAELCLFLARERPWSLSGKLVHVNEPYRDYARSPENYDSVRGLLRRVPF